MELHYPVSGENPEWWGCQVCWCLAIYAEIAQVVERQVEALRVRGPTPLLGTKPLAGYFPKCSALAVATVLALP